MSQHQSHCFHGLDCRWRKRELGAALCQLETVQIPVVHRGICGACVWRDKPLEQVLFEASSAERTLQAHRDAFPDFGRTNGRVERTGPHRGGRPVAPSLWEKAKNYAAHLGRMAVAEVTGVEAGTRTAEEMAACLEICEKCPWGFFDGEHCLECGCRASLDGNAFTSKLAHRASHCPRGAW